jgi:hypothetical protein
LVIKNDRTSFQCPSPEDDVKIREAHYDLVSGVFWFLVGCGFLIGGVRIGFGDWSRPGPGFFPTAGGVVLVILSLSLLAAKGVGRLGRTPEKKFWTTGQSWRNVTFVVLALIGFVAMFNPLGFFFTAFLFLVYVLRFVEQKGTWTSLGTAIAVTVVSYAIFGQWLKVPFPRGWGGW